MNSTNRELYNSIKDPSKAASFKKGAEMFESNNLTYEEMKEAMRLMNVGLENKLVDYMGGQK